jgi:hypothetical protein
MADSPRVERMAKVAEGLTKGIALLTAVLGLVAARDGGLARLAANGGAVFWAAIASAVLSVVLAFAAWMVVAAGPEDRAEGRWLGASALSLTAFTVAVALTMRAGRIADNKLERPAVSLARGVTGLTFTATVERVEADEAMRTTVYGYPSDGGPRELLFNATTGPDAKGHVSVSGAVTNDLSDYEVVEVRAFTGSEDPGCERPGEDVPPEARRAGCAAIWIQPKKGV